MAETLQQNDGIIVFDVLIQGKKIKDTIEIQEISIEMEVNRITSATITIKDGDEIGDVNEGFKNTEGKDFIPGNEIELSLGYKDKTNKVFKGIIVSQRLKVKGGSSQLTITCKDKAVNLTKGRYNSIFRNKSDSDAIKSIINKYELELDIDNTTIQYPVLTQYNCSDWDYLVIRAEANNMVVNNYQNKISAKKIDFSTEPQFEIKSSQFVIDIDLSLKSENISETYNMTSWNFDTQKIVSSSINVEDSLGQGNLSAKKLSGTLCNSSDSYTSTSKEKNEMDLWLESQANRAVLEKIQGKITVPGTSKIVAGDIILLSDFSDRFNGKSFISKVVHKLLDGEWITELYVGKSSKLHASIPDVEELGASGLLPALRGTQIATVKKTQEGPDNNYRVLITLPTHTGTGQEDGIWARIVFPYASGDAGFFFFPEIGDEVLLTFMNDDPRFPIIIGSLYSSKNKPKELTDEKNQFKSIYSKSGINIQFNDKDKILTIETPEKNNIVLNDKEKSISIGDMNDNSIIMDASGITMKTPKDINLKADGNINLIATSNLAMIAKEDATLDGLNITQSAQTSFTAKGNATAELSASGQTTVKGAMVMIN